MINIKLKKCQEGAIVEAEVLREDKEEVVVMEDIEMEVAEEVLGAGRHHLQEGIEEEEKEEEMHHNLAQKIKYILLDLVNAHQNKI